MFYSGLSKNDPRLKNFFQTLCQFRKAVSEDSDKDILLFDGVSLSKEQFLECIQANCDLLCQALKCDFIIPEFSRFCRVITDVYKSCQDNKGGHVADYIPQLARFSPNYWGISICTTDGQRFSIGDSKVPFCLQSSSKPLNYAIALNDLTPHEVHQHVGQEPSGRSFNELSLDHHKKPHNPMINAGAIATVSLLKTYWPIADRYDYGTFLVGNKFKNYSNFVTQSTANIAN